MPSIALVVTAGLGAWLGPDYSIPWWTIDSGGGTSTGGTFDLSGTIGQHDAGPVMTGGSFELTGGFWGAGAATSDCPADVNGDGNLNILDFVAFQDAFTNGDPDADCNNDGNLNILDFVCFQNLFNDGCP